MEMIQRNLKNVDNEQKKKLQDCIKRIKLTFQFIDSINALHCLPKLLEHSTKRIIATMNYGLSLSFQSEQNARKKNSLCLSMQKNAKQCSC